MMTTMMMTMIMGHECEGEGLGGISKNPARGRGKERILRG
jgi:hypothetical protein